MHPSHRYIRYLIIKGRALNESLDPKVANSVLTEYNIPPVVYEQFQTMVERIRTPRWLKFFNTSHKKTIEFMRRHNVYELWHPQNGEEEFFRLLKQPMIADTVKVLLAGGIKHIEVVKRIESKHGVVLTPKAVELYSKFMWDIHAAGYEEWELLLRGYQMRGTLLACLHGSPDQARFRAGFQPRVEGKSFLKEAYRSVYFRMEGTRYLQDNADTAAIVGRYAKELVNIYIAIYGEGAGLEDVLREFKAFMMKTKEPKIKPLKELAPQGNFSGSGVRFIEAKKEKNDGGYELDADTGVGPGPGFEKADA